MSLYFSEQTSIADSDYVLWSDVEDPSNDEPYLIYGLRIEKAPDNEKCLVQYVAIKSGDSYLPLDSQIERLFQYLATDPDFKEREMFLRKKVITDPLQRAHAFCFELSVLSFLKRIEEH